MLQVFQGSHLKHGIDFIITTVAHVKHAMKNEVKIGNDATSTLNIATATTLPNKQKNK